MNRRIIVSLCAALLSSAAFAQVEVAEPWVRATVAQQKATGAFMRLTAAADARLVEARSPAAKVVEIHEMVMDKDVMKMRALPEGLPLPAGTDVDLTPGGYPIMLIDLEKPVNAGDQVPMTLVIEDKDGKRTEIAVDAPARPMNAPAEQAAPMHDEDHGTHH